MFAVVVLLTTPREHCVVPEKYIFGLDTMEADLKTWGANKTHNHLIYWHRTLLNDNILPNAVPDFQARKCEVFPPPPPLDSVCFLGRVKRFFKTFDDAKEFCRKFRPVLPVVYNDARFNAQPTPSNDPNAERQKDSNDGEEEEEEKFELPTVQMDAIDTEALNGIIADDYSESEWLSVDGNSSDGQIDIDDIFESTDNNDVNNGTACSSDAENESVADNENGNEAQFGQVNNNDTLVPAQQTGHEIVQSDTVQNERIVEKANSSRNSNGLNRSHKPAEGIKMVKMNDGRIQVTQTLYDDDDDEIEMTYIQGQELHPKKKDKYHIKKNDALSGNLPFQENAEADRAYLVKVKNGHKEVKLKGNVIQWLIRVNNERGNDKNADKTFIKVLLIGIFTARFIKAGDELEEELIAFIKELFAHRTGGDDERKESFEDLVSIATHEIRNPNNCR